MFDYIPSLGSTVFVSIIMIVIGLTFHILWLQAIKTGVTVEIDFAGMGLVIVIVTNSLSPPIKVMIERFGLVLHVSDVGASPASGVGYATVIDAMIILAISLLNVAMLAARLTKMMNVDIYSYWHYVITDTVIQLMAGSLIHDALGAIYHAALSLKMTGWTTKRVRSVAGLEGISIPQGYGSSSVPLFVLPDAIYEKIPFTKRRSIDAQEIQKRHDMVGNPVIIGVVLDLISGPAADEGLKGRASLMITVTAIMMLSPCMICLIIEGLISTSDDARKFFQKYFKGREVYIGSDTAVMLGHLTTVAAGLLLIPAMLILASILPDNKVLLFADLPVIPFFVCMATVIHRRGLVRTLISGVIVMITVLLIATQLAPYFTEMALRGGFSFAGESTQISASSADSMSGQPISELMSLGIVDVVVAVDTIASVVPFLCKRELSEQGVLLMSWLKEVIGTGKVVIAMCYLRALPGDPSSNVQLGMSWVIDKTWGGLMASQNGGVDAVMFSNRFNLPYPTEVRPETTAAMARIIGQLMSDIRIPFGMNILRDPVASFDLTTAIGARFVHEIFTGTYASDFGVWDANIGETIRHQYRIGADEMKTLFNIVPKAAVYLGNRDTYSIVKLIVFSNHPDTLCVSGLTTGARTDSALLKWAKETMLDTVTLANAGICLENVEGQFSIVDGCMTATTFKKDGVFASFIDQARVSQFIEKVHHIRR